MTLASSACGLATSDQALPISGCTAPCIACRRSRMVWEYCAKASFCWGLRSSAPAICSSRSAGDGTGAGAWTRIHNAPIMKNRFSASDSASSAFHQYWPRAAARGRFGEHHVCRPSPRSRKKAGRRIEQFGQKVFVADLVRLDLARLAGLAQTQRGAAAHRKTEPARKCDGGGEPAPLGHVLHDAPRGRRRRKRDHPARLGRIADEGCGALDYLFEPARHRDPAGGDAPAPRRHPTSRPGRASPRRRPGHARHRRRATRPPMPARSRKRSVSATGMLGCTAALPQGAAGFEARRLFHCIVSLAHRTALCAYLGGPPHRHPRNLLVPPIIALPL